MTNPTPLNDAALPERIYVEIDAETNEKQWFAIKGMGIEYVRALPEAQAVAGVVDRYAAIVEGDEEYRRKIESRDAFLGAKLGVPGYTAPQASADVVRADELAERFKDWNSQQLWKAFSPPSSPQVRTP